MAILSLPKLNRPKKSDPFDSSSYDQNGDPINDAPSIKPPNGIDDFLSQLDELSKPSKGMTDYSEHLKNMPSRDQFHNSTGKNILTLLAGAMTGAASGDPSKGLAEIKAIKDDPFNEATFDWANKGKALKNEADIERENLAAQKGLIGAKVGLLKDQNQQDFRNKQFENTQRQQNQAQQNLESERAFQHPLEERKIGAEERTASAHEKTAQAAIDAIPGKQDKAKEDAILKQSKQYEAEIKPEREADRQYKTMAGLSAAGNTFGDLGALHQYVQSLTKSARASVNGPQALQKAADWETKYNNLMARAVGGRALSPQSIADLVKDGEIVHKAASEQRTKDIQDKFKSVSDRIGVDPKSIMSDYSAPKNANPHKGKTVEQLFEESQQ